jgi:DNA helicase-2/ATP-dependent DNA helicase PcrA
MEVIADLHLHSRYSRAVSQQMVIPEIAKWAVKKGINLVGTGDWTHPLWLRELKENLEEAEEGLYKLKGEGWEADSGSRSKKKEIRFLLTTEISSIYTQGGKSHRIHNLIFAPNLAVVEKINEKLRNYGVNLLSDGRPVTGISSRDLTELVMGEDKNCLVISAHAWTPWYSLYGSQSGFNSIDECYQDMSKYIYAIETGLSSSPAMNWRVEELDNRSIVSFSDAHSPQKLGREATVFEVEDLSYGNIRKAITQLSVLGSQLSDSSQPVGQSTGQPTTDKPETENRQLKTDNRVASTIEFYPEEGKYHWSGHRNCGVKQSPEETKKLGTTCPVCGRKITVGVMHRVEELASRPANFQPAERPSFKMLVPLMEILSEVIGNGVSSQNVENEYNRLTQYFGSEFEILLKTPLEEIAKIGGEKLAEGIKKVREGDIFVDPGYDGVFGTVKIWGETKKEAQPKQMGLF